LPISSEKTSLPLNFQISLSKTEVRITNSLQKKLTQFNRWIEKGICTCDDIFIIALQAGQIYCEKKTPRLDQAFFVAIYGNVENIKYNSDGILEKLVMSPGKVKRIIEDEIREFEAGVVYQNEANIISGFLVSEIPPLGASSHEFRYAKNPNATNKVNLKSIFPFATQLTFISMETLQNMH